MTAKAILEILASEVSKGAEDFGIRVLSECEQPKIGDVLGQSRVWIDNDPTDEMLDGTCAAKIRRLSLDCVEETLSWIYSYNTGSNRYALLVGDTSSYYDGLEEGAVILKNATVLALWKQG